MNVIGILSYQLPSITDSLVEQLKDNIKVPHKLIVLDNGSDLGKISKYTTHRLGTNTRLTGGMNKLLEIAKEHSPDYIWLCTNDIHLETNSDMLESLINKCLDNEEVGVVHPSLIEPVPNYAYSFMVRDKAKNDDNISMGHPLVDIIAPLYTKKALDFMKWKFDDRFAYGWGIDYDSCWIIRKNGLKIAVDFDSLISHQTSITYDSGNDKEFKNRQEYYKKASQNMNEILSLKYGTDWRKTLGV